MSEPLTRMRHRLHGRRTMLHLERLSLPGTPALGLAAAGVGTLPHLGMPDPEGSRSAWLSGSLSVAIHGGLIGALVLFAWLSPDIVEQIIPVQIVRELPGSNEEPAPARPKTLMPRRAAVAQQVTPRQLTQAVRPQVAAVSTQTLQVAKVDLKAAPTQLDRTTITASRVNVARSVGAPRINTSSLAIASPVAIRQSDVRAPAVVNTGPASVPTAAPTQIAPRFANVAQPTTAAIESAATLSNAQFAEGPAGISISTALSEDLLAGGGGGTGGTGKAVGVVRCNESAFVQRYYDAIRTRTLDRWEVPEGTASNARVVLTFRLDDSGSASDVSFAEAAAPALGSSAVRALREASPFPSLDSNTRCISGRELTATFLVPED